MRQSTTSKGRSASCWHYLLLVWPLIAHFITVCLSLLKAWKNKNRFNNTLEEWTDKNDMQNGLDVFGIRMWWLYIVPTRSYSVVIGQMKEPSQLIQNLMVCGAVTGIILQDAIPHIRTVIEYSDGHSWGLCLSTKYYIWWRFVWYYPSTANI